MSIFSQSNQPRCFKFHTCFFKHLFFYVMPCSFQSVPYFVHEKRIMCIYFLTNIISVFEYGSNITHRKLNSKADSQEYSTFLAGGRQARLKTIINLNIHTNNFYIRLNIRRAIECCAQVRQFKYLNQKMFLHIIHTYPYQICIK